MSVVCPPPYFVVRRVVFRPADYREANFSLLLVRDPTGVFTIMEGYEDGRIGSMVPVSDDFQDLFCCEQSFERQLTGAKKQGNIVVLDESASLDSAPRMMQLGLLRTAYGCQGRRWIGFEITRKVAIDFLTPHAHLSPVREALAMLTYSDDGDGVFSRIGWLRAEDCPCFAVFVALSLHKWVRVGSGGAAMRFPELRQRVANSEGLARQVYSVLGVLHPKGALGMASLESLCPRLALVL